MSEFLGGFGALVVAPLVVMGLLVLVAFGTDWVGKSLDRLSGWWWKP